VVHDCAAAIVLVAAQISTARGKSFEAIPVVRMFLPRPFLHPNSQSVPLIV
jgi:hypothetical protein